MRKRFLEWSSILVVALATAVPATATATHAIDNLMPNGDFDNTLGVAGWDALSSEMDVLADLGVDANSCPGSESMRIRNLGTSDGHVTLTSACALGIALDTTYEAWADFEFIDATSCSVALDIDYFSSADCSGAPLVHYAMPQYPSSGANGWFQLVDDALPAPPTALSVAVRVRFIKDFAADAQANVIVDRVRLAPLGLVFAEDQEIGSSCRWSETVQ